MADTHLSITETKFSAAGLQGNGENAMLHWLSGEGLLCVEILRVQNGFLRILTQAVESSVVTL